MSSWMWIAIGGLWLVVILVAIALLVLDRRRSRDEMLRTMAGPERCHVDGSLRVGHRRPYDGDVSFCADGLVIGLADGKRFVRYEDVSNLNFKESMLHFTAKRVGSVTLRTKRPVTRDQETVFCELIGAKVIES